MLTSTKEVCVVLLDFHLISDNQTFVELFGCPGAWNTWAWVALAYTESPSMKVPLKTLAVLCETPAALAHGQCYVLSVSGTPLRGTFLGNASKAGRDLLHFRQLP